MTLQSYDNANVDLFAPCWDRIDRIDEQRRDIAAIWNTHLEGHPYHFDMRHEDEGVHIFSVWEEYPMPAEFAIRLGEWLYNVRACLDYIIWATATHVTGILPPPDEDKLQYPVYESKAAWDRNLHRLKHLAEHHRHMLWTMQPFNSDMDANYLGVINNLARIDRHRRPTDGTAYVVEFEPVLRLPPGATATVQMGQRVLVDGNADVARVVVEPWTDHSNLVVNPRIGIDPEVGEWAQSVFWRRVRFDERLKMIQIFLAAEVAVYEYDCTGSTRKPNALTASYIAECDERGPFNIIQRVEEPWEWGPRADGTISTEERFWGIDLSADGPGSFHRPDST